LWETELTAWKSEAVGGKRLIAPTRKWAGGELPQPDGWAWFHAAEDAQFPSHI
jgi:hypothetical protein